MTEQDKLEFRQINIELRSVNNFNATRMAALVARVERLRKHLSPKALLNEIQKMAEESKSADQFFSAWKSGVEMRLECLETRVEQE